MSEAHPVVVSPRGGIQPAARLDFRPGARAAGRWGLFLRTTTAITVILALISVSLIGVLVPPTYRVAATLQVLPARGPVILDVGSANAPYRQDVATTVLSIQDPALIEAALQTLGNRAAIGQAAATQRLADMRDRLRVRALAGTQLIEVSLTGDRPGEMAAVVNALLDAHQRGHRRTNEQRLADKLRLLTAEQQELEARLAENTAQRRGVLASDEASAGVTTAALNARASDLKRRSTELEQQRAVAQARLQALSADHQRADNAQFSPGAPAELEEFFSTDRTLQVLRNELETIQAGLLTDEKNGLMSRHPEVRRKLDQILVVQRRIQQREHALRGPYVLQTTETLRAHIKDADAGLQVVEQELRLLDKQGRQTADRQRRLEDLKDQRCGLEQELGLIKQNIRGVSVSEDEASRVTIHQAAQVPAAPNLDRRPLLSGVAVLLSLALGIAASCLRCRPLPAANPEDMSQQLGIQVFGTVQYFNHQRGAIHAVDRRLLEARPSGSDTATGRAARVRLVTSPLACSGKSAFAMHLARAQCARGQRVLLVAGAADLGEPGSTMGLEDRPGFADVLAGRAALEQVTWAADMPNLTILPFSGDADLAHLLADGYTQKAFHDLAQAFDTIVIDGPSVLTGRDALLLATQVDEVILLLLPGQSMEARRAKELLAVVGASVVGVALNTVTA